MTENATSPQNDENKLVHLTKTEDARFLSFAREYVGLLATVTAIPLLSSVFEVIPEPIEAARLSVLSSFICLIVFASCFLLRGILKRWSDADDLRRFIPWIIVVISSAAAISFTVRYFTIDETNLTWRISAYLSIYPCLIFGLGIFLVTAFTQQEAHNIQSFIDADPHLTKEAPRILNMLQDYVEYRRLCGHNSLLGKVGREFIEPQQKNLELLREGRIEAGRHDAILVNGLLINRPMNGFHAVSDRDLEFWANLEGDFMAREYFRLNQQLLERKHTMVTRVFILSTADLETRSNVIVPILQQHESAGIGWAVVIFEELNPVVANYQNKPLDFALLTGKEDDAVIAEQDNAVIDEQDDAAIDEQDHSGDEIKAISYFRDYRETSRRYTVVFCTPRGKKGSQNNGKEIEIQLQLYRSLFAHCWLASASFKKIFNNPSLFPTSEGDVRRRISAANRKLEKRLASLPKGTYDPIAKYMVKQNDEQVFLREVEVSDVDEIKDAVCWLLNVRHAHCKWQEVKALTEPCPESMIGS